MEDLVLGSLFILCGLMTTYLIKRYFFILHRFYFYTGLAFFCGGLIAVGAVDISTRLWPQLITGYKYMLLMFAIWIVVYLYTSYAAWGYMVPKIWGIISLIARSKPHQD